MTRFLSIFLSVLCLVSCQQEIDIKIDIPSELVVVGNVSPGEESRIRIGTTTTPSSNPILNLESAVIKLSENGEFVSEYEYTEQFSIFNEEDQFYALKYDFKKGATYNISVELDGVETAYSNTTIPTNNNSYEAEFFTPVLISEDDFGVEVYAATIGLDAASLKSEDALYHISLMAEEILSYYTQDTFLYEIPFVVESNFRTQNLEHESGVIFRGQDILEDNDDLTLDFQYLHDVDQIKGRIFLDIRQVSKEYFEFHSTVALQEVSNVNAGLLTQRANNISTNITNGIGLFGSYNNTRIGFER